MLQSVMVAQFDPWVRSSSCRKKKQKETFMKKVIAAVVASQLA